MNRIILTLGATLLFFGCSNAPGHELVNVDTKVQNWPGWRGPTRDGVAPAPQHPPLTWSETNNVIWKTDLPGRGHASPVIWGDRIFLTSATTDNPTQLAMALDRKTGKPLWETVLHKGGQSKAIHRKNTHASCTPVTDGKHLYVNFLHADAIHLSKLDVDGKVIWSHVAGAFLPEKYAYGYAASPILHRDTVILSADFVGGGWVAAFSQESGKAIWKTQRPGDVGYSSPVLAKVADRDQVLLSGNGKLIGYDPADGNMLWSTKGTSVSTAGTMTWWKDRAFAGGGYPAKGIDCVKADGSGKVLWRTNHPVYEQSMLVHRDHLFFVTDSGIAHCLDVRDGTVKWKDRLGGKYSASPVLAGDRIYVTNEAGTTFVLAASSESFDLLASNQLGDEGFATPVFCDGRVYLRTAFRRSEPRREVLYCLGGKE